MNASWYGFTVAFIAEDIGPVSSVVVDATLKKMKLEQKSIKNTREYLSFLDKLKKELPDDINANELCEKLWLEIMNQNLLS